MPDYGRPKRGYPQRSDPGLRIAFSQGRAALQIRYGSGDEEDPRLHEELGN